MTAAVVEKFIAEIKLSIIPVFNGSGAIVDEAFEIRKLVLQMLQIREVV